MKRLPWKRWCSALCVLALVIGLLPVMSANAEAAAVSSGEAQFERFKSELTALLNDPPEITGNSSGLLGASAAGDDEYESARLLILADESLDTGLLTGAAPILYDGYGMWVAQFRTPAAAKQAANVLNQRGIVAAPDVKVELYGYQDEVKNWTSYTSWGVNYCHFDTFMKTYAPALEGKKAVVAVIDNGADVNDPLLKGKVTAKPAIDTSPEAHGTHVAGTIVDCFGPTQVEIRSYDVGSRSGLYPGYQFTSGELTYIEQAAMDGADVINCSLGVNCDVSKDVLEHLSAFLGTQLTWP